VEVESCCPSLSQVKNVGFSCTSHDDYLKLGKDLVILVCQVLNALRKSKSLDLQSFVVILQVLLIYESHNNIALYISSEN